MFSIQPTLEAAKADLERLVLEEFWGDTAKIVRVDGFGSSTNHVNAGVRKERQRE